MKRFEKMKQELKQWIVDLLSNEESSHEYTDLIDSKLSALLEAYDASKWKPYPENIPELYKSVLVMANIEGTLSIENAWILSDGRWFYFTGSGERQLSYVIAFRELPKPFNPEK